jgi:L-ectoine synthase
MIVRRLAGITPIEWGNGLSRRLLLEADGMGYTVTDTIVYAGSRSALQYTSHLEACYCIAGSGRVIDADGNAHVIEQGTMYALDQHDCHYLIADQDQDLRLVCVFSPPLRGDERHNLTEDGFSCYDLGGERARVD